MSNAQGRSTTRYGPLMKLATYQVFGDNQISNRSKPDTKKFDIQMDICPDTGYSVMLDNEHKNL